MFGKFKINLAARRLLEEKLFEQVVQELSKGQKRDGLWAKALSNSAADENKAKALYIKYRVKSIKDEMEISAALSKEAKIEALKREQEASISDEEKRFLECKNFLYSKGYNIKNNNPGWIIREPQGGRQPIDTLDELEQYVLSRRT